eukprot:TRINITY_DN5566_c0_g1_i1.p1 TRINITY_DN5566_c0_g1~~TRINITY_DN5566_c0_g1_i1.p1  ORF type:complete len:270 (+),score=30.63 TRINITY_DN5566_c0_g1_i1:682-1491(+)
MDKFVQFVMGPAGSGKSTYCAAVQKHCATIGRTVHVVNLDPAAEMINYSPSVNVRDLITVEKVMKELKFGPNGGLIYCMDYLMQNMDWLRDEIGEYSEDYLIIDCPGQIELFTHYSYIKRLSDQFESWGYNPCAVYLLDSHFVSDAAKFISGVMMCLSVMYKMELPHTNLLTKIDLWKMEGKSKNDMPKYLNPDIDSLVYDLSKTTDKRFLRLNKEIGELLRNDPLVGFVPLDAADPDSIRYALSHVDNSMQYGENLEPREPKEVDEDD